MFLANPYGGLANQLFGYAFARAVQEKTKAKEMLLSRRFFLRQYRDAEKIPEFFADYYELCPSKVRVCKGRFIEQIIRTVRGVYRRIFTEKADMLTVEQFKKRVNKGYICSRTTKSLCDDLNELPIHENGLILVEGLFQWPKAFSNLREEMRRELTLTIPLQVSAKKILQQIQESQSVCLHVRRGDYLRFASLQVCNYEYYAKGMEYLAKKIEHPYFFVFSDDIDWVKKNYNIPYPHTFVQENHEAPFELELMRNCKHFIISNSTFSWWAQYLCKYKDSLVVAPYPWFTDGREASLYLPDWHVIKVSNDTKGLRGNKQNENE